jgi:hypothetical protein
VSLSPPVHRLVAARPCSQHPVGDYSPQPRDLFPRHVSLDIFLWHFRDSVSVGVRDGGGSGVDVGYSCSYAYSHDDIASPADHAVCAAAAGFLRRYPQHDERRLDVVVAELKYPLKSIVPPPCFPVKLTNFGN